MSLPIPGGPVLPWPTTSTSSSIREPKWKFRRSGVSRRTVQGLGPSSIRPLARRIALDALPERLLLIERQLGKATFGSPLHRAIAAFELVVRRAKCLFRREAVCAHEIDRGEKKIARFFQSLIRCSFYQFADLLEQLGSRPAGVGPVETVARRPLLELFGAKQARERPRHAIHRAGFAPARPLGRLELFPSAFLARLRFVSKNVGVAGFHLVGNRSDHVVEGEMAGFFGDPGVK